MKIFETKPTIVRFIGDVHARYTVYNELVKCAYPTIQVGDFGHGFQPVEIYIDDNEKAQYRAGPAPIVELKDKHIRGNHDDPALCKSDSSWIPDGHIEHNFMFIGGAFSRDHAMRKIGVDWWDDEELSYHELENIIGLAEKFKPTIIVSHECPKYIASIPIVGGSHPYSRTALAFDVILANVKPKLWVFGHYHRHVHTKIDGTEFICCAIDQAIDVDVSDLI